MTVSSSNLRFILILVLNAVQGTLTPNGNVSVDCGGTQRFDCSIAGEPIKWTTRGLEGIGQGPFLPRIAAYKNPRITSTDTGGNSQIGMSDITISGFSTSDNGGTIQCVNANNNTVLGIASISVAVGLRAPANVVAKAKSCDTILLQWDQPSGPADITTSVSCTPPSPGCTECTTSPCNITGLNPSTEYVFAVTLNSVMCGTSKNTTGIGTRDLRAPTNVVATVRTCDNITLQWDQPSEPTDITTSVSCTPPSPGCAECTTSPCTITGLNPSTDYEFTVTLNSGGCKTNMNTTVVRTKNTSSCVASNSTGNDDPPIPPPVDNSSLAALVLLLLPIPFLYPLGVLIAYLLFFKDKSYCEVFWCCYCWRKDKLYECTSTELREHREEAAYQNVPKNKEVVTNGDEIKEPKRSKQEQVVTDEAFKKREGKDEDVITDETVQQQGTPDGHHERRRSRKHKEEVQYQNLDVAKKQQAVTNGDEVKKPKKSKQENIATNEPVRQQGGKDGVVNTGNVKQQQGNLDGIQYADLDFSEHQTGRIVILPLVDPVTYADV